MSSSSVVYDSDTASEERYDPAPLYMFSKIHSLISMQTSIATRKNQDTCQFQSGPPAPKIITPSRPKVAPANPTSRCQSSPGPGLGNMATTFPQIKAHAGLSPAA